MFKEVLSSPCSKSGRSLVHGVGTNDSTYATSMEVGGKIFRCPFYVKWVSMLSRCYSEAFLSRRPTYKGSSVCHDWLTFSVFKDWMMGQDWEGKALDKDIIRLGNKVYSPSTCCFVSTEVNSLVKDCRGSRGPYPRGVYLDKGTGKYRAQCKASGKVTYLGCFDSPEAASAVHNEHKAGVVRRVALGQESPMVMRGLIIYADKILNNTKGM